MRKRVLVVSAAVLVLLLVAGISWRVFDLGYYRAGPDFTFSVSQVEGAAVDRGYGPRGIVEAEYVGEGTDTSFGFRRLGTEYRFEVLDTGESLTIGMPSDVADDIKLASGTAYLILYEIILSEPSFYSLVIWCGDDLVFAGITDVHVDRYFVLDGRLVPVKVEQTRLLTWHYAGRDQCWDRITNTEIAFSIEGESVCLHQGQSAKLGDYQINLTVAREVQYSNQWPGCSMSGVSYIISRDSEAALPSTSSRTRAIVPFPDSALAYAVREAVEASDEETGKTMLSVLRGLDASARGTTDLTGLEKCTVLQGINLAGNPIEDISPLLSLLHLSFLRLDNTRIRDISPLVALAGLRDIYLTGNELTEISALARLTALRTIDLRGNQITDISALVDLPDLRLLDLRGNPLNDESVNSVIPQLEERGVDVRWYGDALGGDPIPPVSPLALGGEGGRRS